jgi:AcrR family transcriptional regulator
MAGRPRTFDRTEALETAVQAFWRHGYEETTVAELTQAMGITPPSLYAAFGDKEQLFREAAGCYSERTCTALALALDRPTAHEGIAELMAVTARAHTDSATPPGCFVLTEPRLGRQREDLGELIAARVRRGLEDGDVPAGTDPTQLSSFLLAVLTGMSSRARDGASAEEISAIATLALAAVPMGPVPSDAEPLTAGHPGAGQAQPVPGTTNPLS